MSKISYCSLEEAWGDSYKTNKNEKNDKNNKKNIENNKIYQMNKYDHLNDNSEIERKEIIKNMNSIERNNSDKNNIENNSIVEYEKYRFNPINKVNNNNYEQTYTPFNDSIEKKYLQDKLNFLENEFRKYKNYIENDNYNYKNNNIENFSNNDGENKNNKSNDIIDLILLIIIGLIVIFVMNSIFNIGKSIGARNKII
jgi:hypothetical protein